jgi:hypothetical protein
MWGGADQCRRPQRRDCGHQVVNSVMVGARGTSYLSGWSKVKREG